ncbi:unnamed protein product [Discula destructiva]
MVDGDVVALRFKLGHAGDLIVPQQSSLVPKKKVYGDVLDSLKLLSQELDFVVYLRSSDLPPQNCLLSLCEAVTSGRWTTSTGHADIATFYDGKGGKVLRGEDLAVSATGTLESPPSYDHAGSPPPAPVLEKDSVVEDPEARSNRKRRRTSSSPAYNVTDGVTRTHIQDADHVEAICRRLMGVMDAKWRADRDQLRNALQQMEARMKVWVDERLSKHVADFCRELQETSVESRNHVDEEVHGVRRVVEETDDRVEEMHEDLQALTDETSELVDAKVDERMDAVRGELEEFLDEKMHEAQDRIVDHIRSNVYIDFNIYE